MKHEPPKPHVTARMFRTELEQQFALCQKLEALADTLPSGVDTRAAAAISDQLRVILQHSHEAEETIIFAALVAADPLTRPILDRLRMEHREDEDHVRDICDAIAVFAHDQSRTETEELGYMLRCLFTSLRRHIAFDRDYILPLYLRAIRDEPLQSGSRL